MSNHKQPFRGLPPPGSDAAPKYWTHETSGILGPVVQVFLHGGILMGQEIVIMRSYLAQWVNSEAWAPGDALEALRQRVAAIETHQDVKDAVVAAVALGMDPL